MDINQNYREAVKTIKEAILRSQYRAASKRVRDASIYTSKKYRSSFYS